MENEKLVIHPKRPKGEDGYRTFSVRIREEVVDAINRISEQTGRSRNELIGMFLEYALERYTISDHETE